MYFFFIGTWRLNILKIVVLNIPKLFTLEEALTIPVDTGRKLNVHKSYVRSIYVVCQRGCYI